MRQIGRACKDEVQTLKVGLDFRKPEYRREVFLRFYEFHLEHRSHPGCVYFAMPWLAKKHKLDDEAKLWLAFINGNTQNIVTSWTIFKRFPTVAAKGLPAWFEKYYDGLAWDTDRRYHKKDFIKSVQRYAELVGSSQKKYFRSLEGRTEYETFDKVWEALRSDFYTFGRLSSFSYSEYLRIMGIPLDCGTLFLEDMEGSKSHRNGLAKVLGRDDMDWFRETDFKGDYTAEELDWLRDEAAQLLTEAKKRTAKNKAIDPREVHYFTMESALCTYKSWSRKNRRYPNCLAGSTAICSPEGDIPIRKLVGKRYPVYTVNEETRGVELSWAVGSYSGKRQTVIVTLDDGSELCVTSDHRFLTRRRTGKGLPGVTAEVSIEYEWVCAGDLQKKQRLIPLHRFFTTQGYEGYLTNRKGRDREWRLTSRAYYELVEGSIPEGFHVHHKNENKKDNRFFNLELLEGGFHIQQHKSIVDGSSYKEPWTSGKGRPLHPISEAELLKMGKRLLRKSGKLTCESFKEEYKGKVSTYVVSSRWGRWANYLSAIKENHKVVSVRRGPTIKVYDLSVEKNHNFFVGSGVLVHNCYSDMFFERIQKGEQNFGKEEVAQFWDCRLDCLPEHLLLECTPNDPGLVPEKQNHYRETGEVIMMSKKWPEFDNSFDRRIWAKSPFL